MSAELTLDTDLAGIRIPDSKLAREIMEVVRDTESPLLFHHSIPNCFMQARCSTTWA
jgi:hypothetical protein